jgi:hypothetical protein
MSRLLEGRQQPWVGEPAEETSRFDEADQLGFEVLQESRIYDLRDWKPVKAGESDAGNQVFAYRRLKVFKKPENTGNNVFQVYLLATSPQVAVRFPAQQLQPRLSMCRLPASGPTEKGYHWRASYDFQQVPAGEFVDLLIEYHSPGRSFQRGGNGAGLLFPIRANTAELTAWILMPEGRPYASFRIVRYPTAKPEAVEPVKVVTEYLAEELTILAFKLLSLEAGYDYEVSWTYQ